MPEKVQKPAGKIGAQEAEALLSAIESSHIDFDFSDVTDINFAALRCFLDARRAGKRFAIVNASDAVAEKFEDTGVSCIVSVSRKPKALDMSKYEVFGESFLSKAYNSEDGDAMIKVYGPHFPARMVAQEKAMARAVMLFGLPTPLVGTLYSDGQSNALDFERIPGKRSFSRIISEEPERMEEITVRFAAMCKQLHSTPCDTSIFPDRTDVYRGVVARCDRLTDAEKARIFAFIDSVPKATTCLHGDLQISNVISSPRGDMWIDLSDFSYGNPMLDIGMWYFLSKLNPEERVQHLFHMGNAQMSQIWDIFAREYFGADTPEALAEAEKRVQPFAALHMIYLCVNYWYEPGLFEFAHSVLLPE